MIFQIARLWLNHRGWEVRLSEPGLAGLVDFQDWEVGTPMSLSHV